MKNISSFLVGTLSTMGMVESIGTKPEIIDAAQSVPVDSLEAILSLVGGTISTIIVALLKRRWNRRAEKQKKELIPPGD